METLFVKKTWHLLFSLLFLSVSFKPLQAMLQKTDDKQFVTATITTLKKQIVDTTFICLLTNFDGLEPEDYFECLLATEQNKNDNDGFHKQIHDHHPKYYKQFYTSLTPILCLFLAYERLIKNLSQQKTKKIQQLTKIAYDVNYILGTLFAPPVGLESEYSMTEQESDLITDLTNKSRNNPNFFWTLSPKRSLLLCNTLLSVSARILLFFSKEMRFMVTQLTHAKFHDYENICTFFCSCILVNHDNYFLTRLLNKYSDVYLS